MTMIILSILLWWAAVTRGLRWRRSQSVFALGTTVVFAAMASHTTVNIGAIDRVISDLIGVANATSAVKHVIFLGICLGAALILVALRVPTDYAQRRWIAPLILGAVSVAAVSLILFFSATDVAQAASGYEFDERYAHLPGYAESAALVMVMAAVLCTMITIVGLLGWDVRTPQGRGLAIITPGLAILAAYCWMRAGYIVAARAGWIEPTPAVVDLSTRLVVVGILLTTLGMLWGNVENRVVRSVQWRDCAALYRELVGRRWRGVARPSHTAAGVRRVEDRASEVLDALSMQARHDGLPEESERPVTPAMIAQWIRTGEVGPVGIDGLRPPEGVDQVQWVRSVGRAFVDQAR